LLLVILKVMTCCVKLLYCNRISLSDTLMFRKNNYVLHQLKAVSEGNKQQQCFKSLQIFNFAVL
jgi:hypothetical protein